MLFAHSYTEVVIVVVVNVLLQGNDGSLILEQLAGIDMLTQEGESSSVSNMLLQIIYYCDMFSFFVIITQVQCCKTLKT